MVVRILSVIDFSSSCQEDELPLDFFARETEKVSR